MSNFLAAFLRVLFALLLGIATALTAIIMSPLMLIMWIWNKLNDTPPNN